MTDTAIRATKRAPIVIPEAEPEKDHRLGIVWGIVRLGIGWTFLWAFLDRAFAMGFSTGRNPETGAIDFFGPGAWVNGGSPTTGVLQFALKGPFAGFYRAITGTPADPAQGGAAAWVDWLYMASMLAIGLALVLGVFVKLGSLGGILWMVVFYTATAIWPEFNPFWDEHLLQIVLLAGIVLANAGLYLGFGHAWQRTNLVRRHPILM